MKQPFPFEQSQQDLYDKTAVRGLSDLYIPEDMPGAETGPASAPDIVDTLLQIGAIDTQQFQQLRQQQSLQPSGQIEQILKESEFLTEQQILSAKAKLYGLQYRQITPDDVDKSLVEQLNLEMDFITSNGICPVNTEGGNLIVATNDPANIFAIEDIKRRTRLDVQVVVCSSKDIEAICEAIREEAMDYNVDDIISDMTDVEVVEDVQKDFEDLERMAGQSPVIKFVNYLISNAINSGASDLHIEPKNKNTRIRYRIDGVLFETMTCPAKMHPAVVSRIKIMSNLDISERRLPQDGKVSVIVGGRAIDLRISVLPTNRGEKVVIRILDSKSIMRGLEELGMDEEILQKFRTQIAMPNGIFLVTGPTGSGKSTTLYSALSQMDGDRLNISTVEDPVEYELDFCNQVQANEKIGLDFASALRSLLRQDPDIIMIGEIRDQETAKIAVQAALTGHLVFSTLHTNDAASSITRLVDIGIDPYLIAASLNGVLAQRLVRRICPKCRQPYNVPESMQRYIENAGIKADELYHGLGCDNCRNSGYVGRIGIYELLIVDDAIRDMINRDPSVGAMRQAFRASGAGSLFDDGLSKIKAGQTTLEEVLRVTEITRSAQDEQPEEASCDTCSVILPATNFNEPRESEETKETPEIENGNIFDEPIERQQEDAEPPEQAANNEDNPQKETELEIAKPESAKTELDEPEQTRLSMSEWESVQGFRSAALYGEKRAWSQETIPENFELSVNAELLAGNGYGIWFRTDSETLNGYCFQYDAGLNGGSLVLNKWRDGAQKQIEATPFPGPWRDLSRQIEIKAIDYEISVSLDGREVIRCLDSQYRSGKVGLRLWDGSEAHFENIVVKPIGSNKKVPNSIVTGLNQQ